MAVPINSKSSIESDKKSVADSVDINNELPVVSDKNNRTDSAILNSELPIADKLSTPINEAKSPNGTSSVGNTPGLSATELNDANSISVTVADPDAPLIVLFGPPDCGKTMTLVRLTRYLKTKGGYTVAPIRTFRPESDTNYGDICTNFDSMINDDNAAASTQRISFMLVEVIKNGKRLCQILEAPGEFYFDPEKTKQNEFPNYVNKIIASNNRKIWTIMVEPDWKDQTHRNNYVSRIAYLKQKMRSKDKTVFIFNKIDKTNFIISVGNIHVKAAITEIQNLYPNIFIPFLNQNPITKLWKKHNCKFVPFQTGFYTKAVNGLTYQAGPEEYCTILWNTLMKNIYG